MAAADNLARMVPGFEFMQGMLKTATAGLPNLGQWMAPTINPEELDKRIQELKTVQFWLDQNAKLLGATIQGLEVQKMTLNTLQSMNFPLTELGEALKIKLPATPPASPPQAPAPAPAAPAARAAEPATEAAAAPAAPLVDPMQWWGALTQQFTEIAAKAVKDSAADTAMNLAGAMAQAPLDAAKKMAEGVLKKATSTPAKTSAKPSARASAQPSTKPPGKAPVKAAARKRAR